MRNVDLDKAPAAVKKFFRGLPIDNGGIALKMDGRVVARLIGPNQLSDSERKALIEKVKTSIRKARQRTKDIPPRVIRREIEESIAEVRRRNKR